MKKLTNIFIFLLFTLSVKGQMSQSSSSQLYDENIETGNNTTIINLYNIDYNGTKIPIDISYSHDGIKVSDKPDTGLGIKWRINEIGIINRTVNYFMDDVPEKGWFNSLNPSFQSSTIVRSCNPNRHDCFHFGAFDENDLTPDFFSLNLCNGINFDFLYKKNIQNGILGIPTPQFLSNPDGYKINTNFDSFDHSCGEPNSNVVFNILDKFGNNYDFVNGPALADSRRAAGIEGGCRRNFYLKTISNHYNSDYVSVEYASKNIQKERWYAVGFREYSTGQIFNGVLQNTSGDYYIKDESRFDITKITTNKEIIDFIYDIHSEYLTELRISDFNSNHIVSYYFIYEDFEGAATKTLTKIYKDVTLTPQSPVLYSFEYYAGDDFFEYDNVALIEDCGNYEDYFGYFMGEEKQSMYPVPFTREGIPSGVIPASNFEPNLYYTKQHSLYRIINKYSGITEFDYQLKRFNDPTYGYIYGGGLQISSIKKYPNIGKSTLVNYDYQNLKGFVIASDYLGFSYLRTAQIGSSHYTFCSTMANLFDNENNPINPGFDSIQRNGSFFGNITESIYDLSTLSLLSKTEKTYTSCYEGMYRRPMLSSEKVMNSSGSTIKSIEYSYDYQVIETIPAAEYNAETRYGGLWILNMKTERPIPINRINLTQKKETLFNPDPIEEITNYSYVGTNSKLVRSQIQSPSSGADIETKYFYAADLQSQGEGAYISDLISKNIIGKPLVIQKFKGTDKLEEQKTVYIKDPSTSNLLEPKYVFSRKGNDSDNPLEKKITYDYYDDKGNVTQYTEENGFHVALIWGYKRTKLIAKIENMKYATIASLATAAQNASDISNNETNLLTSLNALRNNSALANSFITTYTYIPLVGVSTITDPKGERVIYSYDNYGKIIDIRKMDNINNNTVNILLENEYNYKP